MDVVVVSVFDKAELSGCFLFSKHDLKDYFSGDDSEGRHSFFVYPPLCEPKNKRSRRNQFEQARFYVDLRLPMNERVFRFQRLFERARRISPENSPFRGAELEGAKIE